MIEPLTPGWYTWADSSQSDHLIAHWFGDRRGWSHCEAVHRLGRSFMPATFQRHCKRCERALAEDMGRAKVMHR